jgi:hypothetical protein
MVAQGLLLTKPTGNGTCQGETHAPQQTRLLFDPLIDDGDQRLRIIGLSLTPPLLNGDGKTADQPCDRLQVPAVLVFEESGEPLNTFVVAVPKRFAIDLGFSL